MDDFEFDEEQEQEPLRKFKAEDWQRITGKVPICGARTRNGTPCKYPAGYGTDHFGVGRCFWHDRHTPTKKFPLLFYLDPELQNAVSTFINTDEILDLRTELAVLRYRFAEINNIDMDSMDSKERRAWLKEMSLLSREISRLTETIVTLERGMHKYIHISVTGTILSAIAGITREFIPADRVEEFMSALSEAVREGISKANAKEL
ncbi:MAG: hypothetical protein ACTSRF_09955, partial [Candidatus Freyarchaeota archaeon]